MLCILNISVISPEKVNEYSVIVFLLHRSVDYAPSYITRITPTLDT